MAETRRKFDQDFKEGAVRLVRETGRPIAQVATDLGINEGTLGNWVNADLSGSIIRSGWPAA
jgi:transposase